MVQIVEQTHDEKVEMYKKCTKMELIGMLISCNLHLEAVTKQLNKLNVVRGGDSESQLVERTKRYFKYPDWVERRITPPEPLATEARDTVAEARDFRHCYIRTKIGCHCTDECGYDALMRGISDEGQP